MDWLGERAPGVDGALRLEALLEHSFDLLLVVDAEQNISYASPSYQEILGFPPSELVGRSAMLLAPPEDAAELELMADDLMANPGKAIELQYRNVHSDGSIRHFQGYIQNRLDDPIVGGIVVNGRDVTALVEANAERLAFEARLVESQRRESLGALAGGVAHSFNNLLAVILGNAGLARSKLDDDSPLQSELEDIEIAARRAANLTRQMMIYAGRGRFESDELDLSKLVEEIHDLLEVAIARSSRIEYDLEPALPPIAGDAASLHQVVVGLVTNASEALDGSRGVVTIRTCRHDDTHVRLEVADTGSGIDPSVQSHVFEPFFTTKFTGRGLGLASVQGIVDTLGGSIYLASEPDRGTTFFVTFPVVEPAHPASVLPPGSDLDDGGLTILVVDDEASVRLIVRRVLGGRGMRVLEAGSGTDALELFRSHQPIDLVLLDLTMEGMSGEETLLELRAIDPGVRVVLMSGYHEDELATRLEGAPVRAFLAKPFDIHELEATVRAAR